MENNHVDVKEEFTTQNSVDFTKDEDLYENEIYLQQNSHRNVNPFDTFKNICRDDNNHSKLSWERKHPRTWNQFEVRDWCSYIFEKYSPNSNYKYIVKNFSNKTGADLIHMKESDFEIHSEMGTILFILFRDLLEYSEHWESNQEKCISKTDSDFETSEEIDDMNHNTIKIGARRGRKPGQKTKGNHLWEFLRDLLNNPSYNPSMIRWFDKSQGIFLIESTKDVAAMWGKRKKNTKMTYEKLARALRYCRQLGDFDTIPRGYDVPKKRCFKFGSSTHGWRDGEVIQYK